MKVIRCIKLLYFLFLILNREDSKRAASFLTARQGHFSSLGSSPSGRFPQLVGERLGTKREEMGNIPDDLPRTFKTEDSRTHSLVVQMYPEKF